jgi:hypothetical protein
MATAKSKRSVLSRVSPKFAEAVESQRVSPLAAKSSKLVSATSSPKLGTSSNLLQHLKKFGVTDLNKLLKEMPMPETDEAMKEEESWAEWLLGKAKEYGPKLVEMLPELLAML